MTTIARIRTVGLLACLVVGISARPASAQEFGGRLGVSGDPGQFYVGVHGDFGQVVPPLSLRPNFEAGFGSGGQLYGFNIEFTYPLALSGSLQNAPYKPYILAGPALVVAHASGGGSSTGAGFNFGFGLKNSKGLFGEIKFGVADSPTIKFGIGVNFG